MWKMIVSWFLKKGWPVILQLLQRYKDEIIRYVFKLIKEYIENKKKKDMQDKAEKVKQKKASYDNTNDHSEKEKIFKDMEDLEKEMNDYNKVMSEMESIFEEIKQKATDDVAKSTSSLRAEDVLENDDKNETLKVKENTNMLQLNNNQSHINTDLLKNMFNPFKK
ncbi:hypothetical protein AB3Z07_09450 [Metabacillus halosaccharovorans]|uniref:hypothetical protein n=1 Tax=Metabacillus halosaccharovorans TaxID=930124 RepID=UPI0034CE52F6